MLTATTTSKKRGRPKKCVTKTGTKSKGSQIPAGRVFSVSNNNLYNNFLNTVSIISLNLNKSDIQRLEMGIQNNLDFIGQIKETTATVAAEKKQKQSPFTTLTIMKSQEKESFGAHRPTKTRMKRTNVQNRKDLIINCGVKRTTYDVLDVNGKSWPEKTNVVCWHDCHPFTTTPVGIPQTMINHTFVCSGNFCSYNCAKKYLCPNMNDEDDMSGVYVNTDIFVGDSHGDKLQLLELLCHLETGSPLTEIIKPAGSRLALKMFGGNKTIEEFRESFSSNTSYHIFKMPLVSIGYQIEECQNVGNDGAQKLMNMSLDVHRLQKEYDSLMKENNFMT